jgi:hypothetical protein
MKQKFLFYKKKKKMNNEKKNEISTDIQLIDNLNDSEIDDTESETGKKEFSNLKRSQTLYSSRDLLNQIKDSGNEQGNSKFITNIKKITEIFFYCVNKKGLKREEQIKSLLLSEKTYLTTLNEIDELMQKLKDCLDNKYKEVLASFFKIREIHLKMAEEIEKEEQQNEKDWNKISLRQSFIEIYPILIDEYTLYILHWEEFCDHISKNKSILKLFGERQKYFIRIILDKTLNVVTRTMRYPRNLFFFSKFFIKKNFFF